MDILTVINRKQHFIERLLGAKAFLLLLPLFGFSVGAIASGNFYSTGPQSTYGSVTYAEGNYINGMNPASGAFHRQYMDPQKTVIGRASFGAGLEYGGVDDLFDQIDDLSGFISSSANNKYKQGVEVGDGIDLQDPELEKLIEDAKKSATLLTGTLFFIEAEGYAHTYVDSNVNFLINRDIAKGTLAFSFQSSLSSTFIGIADAIDFDPEVALAELQNLYDTDLQPGDDIVSYDLSGGITLSIDPSSGKVSAQFENDSVLIGKAARVVEFGLTYSRLFSKFEQGQLFWGIKPKVNWIGLTQVAVRLGDISDAEKLFESADNQTFNYDVKLGLDLGVYWHANHYALGATLINTTEPSFYYPALDTSRYNNEDIIKKIEDESHFQLERQLSIEASLFSDDYRWFTGASLDVNAIQDPLQQRFQWLSWSNGYQPSLWWFSNIRSGVKHNLVGAELTYLNLGMTFLKYINLDFSSTFKVTSINDIDLPRGLRADVGVNFAF